MRKSEREREREREEKGVHRVAAVEWVVVWSVVVCTGDGWKEV